MATGGDFITLVDEPGAVGDADQEPRWKVAIVDDDEAVHEGSRFALDNYSLHGRGLELLSARSADEARALFQAHPDIAVVLLDVVMESDTAGLDFVNYIRDDLNNDTVRIILRTGQPGQAPEQRIIVDYDINDYKAKTELTSDKLFTAITAALRSYEQLKRLDETRRGLEIIVEATPTLFDYKSIQRLAEGVLTQLASLLDVNCVGILVLREGGLSGDFSVLAGAGCYKSYVATDECKPLGPELRSLILDAFSHRGHQFLDGRYLLYVGTGSGREVVVLLEATKQLSDTDRAMVEVLCSRLSIAFDNVALYDQLQQANSTLEERVIQRTSQLTAANGRLRAHWERLRAANNFKSEILGKVAHDLRNPLSVIVGRTEILNELIPQTPFPVDKAQSQVESIQKSARRLAVMVDELIDQAMADALDISIRHEQLDLAMLVTEVVEANRPLAEQKQQEISVAAPESVSVNGDHGRLRDAIDNLLSNAIKYSPVGGRIAISVASDTGASVICVRDTGPGLSPEDKARLFGRFQRLSAKPTAGESSTGLGLSIVKRIVDLHGGRVTAENADAGEGAIFTIALPVDARPSAV